MELTASRTVTFARDSARATASATADVHVGSYYAASANRKSLRPSLRGDFTSDVCIVGGGYSGLSAAIALAERGYQVCVLEAKAIGFGASGRNGGQIVNGLNASLEKIERQFGAHTASFVGAMVQEGGEIIKDRINKYQIDCDFRPGNLFAAYNDAHMRMLEAKKRRWLAFGMDDHELLDEIAIRNHVGSDAYCGGMIDRSGGHMHPLNLALGEADAVESLGGKIFELSPVRRLLTEGGRHVIETDQGRVNSKILILCGNAYLAGVAPEIESRVLPVSTQMVATEPLDASRAAELLPTNLCVEDVRYILDYFRLSADNRLLFGGGTVYGGADPKDIRAKLAPHIKAVFPQLAGVELEYAWSGNFALSFSRVPQMGRLESGAYFAHGYSGHGVTGSHLFGKILADAAAGDAERFDVFSRLPYLPFPGGRTFRVPYSVVGSWWYGLRDSLGV